VEENMLANTPEHVGWRTSVSAQRQGGVSVDWHAVVADNSPSVARV